MINPIVASQVVKEQHKEEDTGKSLPGLHLFKPSGFGRNFQGFPEIAVGHSVDLQTGLEGRKGEFSKPVVLLYFCMLYKIRQRNTV